MISTMNTRTGNAQSRGVSQIELEEDAMLTAIGQSSIDEMADKYADRWEDFVASLSRWRSIHQLLRLGQLNKTLQRLNTKQSVLKEQLKIQDSLIKQCQILSTRCADIMTAFEVIKMYPKPYNLGKSGRKPYDTRATTAVMNQALITSITERINGKNVETIGAGVMVSDKIVRWFTKPASEWQEDLEYAEDNLELANIKKRKGQKELDETRVELQKTQDQYDITKPYAMGLLVADIFYTLASAIQGEIYL